MRSIAFAALLGVAGPPGDSVVRYAAVGGWDVWIDLAKDGECYLTGRFGSGTVASFGVDHRKSGASGYLVLASPTWKGMADGSDQMLNMRFDGEKPWRGRARVVVVDGVASLTVRFLDPRFARQFAFSKALLVDGPKGRMASLSLGSSGEALRAMVECQAEVDEIARDAREEEEIDDPKPMA